MQSRTAEGLFLRSLDHFPSTELLIPLPTLEFDFRIIVDLDPQSPNFNPVHKEAIAVLSGQWSGTFGNGHVLVGNFSFAKLHLISAQIMKH